jgi:Zn-dependent protease with chaperone function
MERGKIREKLRGDGERCLILGLAALSDLRLSSFKAILAHEYGHFSNKDTAGGNLANQINRSMYDMAFTLIVKRLARWYNPAWWFLSGFRAIYLRATLGASRLQEILADRIAAMSYGVQNFVNGLTHVIRQNLLFNMQLNTALNKNAAEFEAVKNIYALPSVDSDDNKQLETKLAEVMQHQSSAYDSHPAPNERFALLEKLNLEMHDENLNTPVTDLISNYDTLQLEMTTVIQSNILNRIRAAENAA